MVPTCKQKHQNRRLLTELKEFLNDFFIDKNTNTKVAKNETIRAQNGNFFKNFDRSTVCEIGITHGQLMEKNITGRIRKEVINVVMIVKNGIHDEILIAMEYAVILRVEMTVRLIAGSSGRGPDSLFSILTREVFQGTWKILRS